MIGALALTACGQGSPDDQPGATAADGENSEPDGGEESTESDGEATIRYAWWGSDTRAQLNQELIDLFMEEHPDITIIPDYSEFSGYWDKLATQTAGGDTPDVMMQEERYLREYAERGVLADLSDYDIDTANIEDALLGSGQFNDGLWGVPTGANVFALIVDPQVFENAGVQTPDDTSWTWDEYASLMAGITENTPDGVYGTRDFGFIEGGLNIWLRQHGQSLWDENGEIGFEPQLLAEFWEFSLDLIESGAAPPATLAVERLSGGPEQSMIATNEAAVASYWSSQLQSLTNASGRELELLRLPGETEFERSGLFFKPAMAISMSAETEYPEAAATFIDWMLNSPQAGELILNDRGLPANLEVREHIRSGFTDVEQIEVAFIESVAEDIVDAPPPPPPGAGQVSDILGRLNEAVLFEQITPEEGAEQFVAEASQATG